MLSKLIILLALALPIFSSSTNPRPRRYNLRQNQWEIEGLMIYRWNRTDLPKLGATFWLYRSYNVSCDTSAGSWGELSPLLLFGEKCGYFIPDHPVHCSDGEKMNGTERSSMWKSSLSVTNYWSTCSALPRGVEGERELSEDKKRWLKWRVVDLEERDPQTIPDPKPNYPREIPFISAKLQVVNGVPIEESNAPTSKVKVFNTILTLGKGGADYQCRTSEYGNAGPEYKCGFVIDPTNKKFICERPLGPCSQLVNVTETVESLSEFQKRFY